MAQDYTIKEVFEEVNRWNGKFGPMITYKMLLEETGEEVIDQNKKPDSPAPKVGDVLYADIERNAFGAKLKVQQKPDGTFSGSVGKGSETASKPAWKDNSKDITLGMVWKTVAGIRGLPENQTDFTKFFEIVRSHLDELLLMSEQMNRGSQTALPAQAIKSDSQPAPGIKTKLDKGFTEEDLSEVFPNG